MKAIVCTEFGSPDDLQVLEVEKPVPKDDEVLVKVHAASVNAADMEILKGMWTARVGGPFRPLAKILGSDLAGRVEAVGRDAKQFQSGDNVWGDLSFPYGYGTFAEYVSVSEKALAPKPAGMSFEEASTYPQAAIIALQSLRNKGKVGPGQKVLINGAGGGMGTFAVQIAKYYGAEVTGVDRAEKLEMVRSIGADHAINYAEEDYTRGGKQYDLILDIVADRSAFDYRRALNPGGIFMIVGGSLTTFLQVLILGTLISRTTDRKIGLNAYDSNNKGDLEFLGELFEAGDVVPVIDRHFTLSEVPEALRYFENAPYLGKLVITTEQNSSAL